MRARLASHSFEQVDQFGKFCLLGGGVTRRDRLMHAAGGMILQHGALHPADGRFDRLNLVEDVDAVPAIRNHLGYAAHLPFDTSKPMNDGLLVLCHAAPLSV